MGINEAFSFLGKLIVAALVAAVLIGFSVGWLIFH